MLAVHVRISGTCRRCGTPTSLDALEQGLFCPGCGDAVAIGPEAFAQLVGDDVARAPHLAQGTVSSQSVLAGDSTFTTVLSHREPTCSGCERAFSGLGARRPEAPVTCPHCGREPLLRARPTSWLAPCFERVTHLLDEAAGVVAERAAERTCPRCGAGLPLVPGQRVATCSYCHVRVVVPDALHRLAHADARGFYLLFDAPPLAVERVEHVHAPENVRGVATFEEHSVEVGDVIQRGRTVATLRVERQDRTVSLRSPCAGTVVAVNGARGAVVGSEALVSIAPSETE